MKGILLFLFTYIITSAVLAQGNKVTLEITTSETAGTVLHCYFKTGANMGEMWKSVATSEGLSKWAAPSALVEPKVGGAYELYFRPDNPKGKRGMEGNKVISFLPEKMISYSGGLSDTWVVYLIEKCGSDQVLHFYALGTHPEWVSKCQEQASGVEAFVQKLADYLK